MVLVATEDPLSEAVASKIIAVALGGGVEIRAVRRNGNGYLRKRLSNLIDASRTFPVVLLTDLDQLACAPNLIRNWTHGRALPERFRLRVAVREVEAWLLADRRAISTLFSTSIGKVEPNPEGLVDPKRFLLRLAQDAPRRIREELLPSRGSVSIQGFGYNDCLCKFVANDWSPERASDSSPSLKRAIERIQELGTDT